MSMMHLSHRHDNKKHCSFFLKKRTTTFQTATTSEYIDMRNLRQEVLEESSDVGCDSQGVLRQSPPVDDSLER